MGDIKGLCSCASRSSCWFLHSAFLSTRFLFIHSFSCCLASGLVSLWRTGTLKLANYTREDSTQRQHLQRTRWLDKQRIPFQTGDSLRRIRKNCNNQGPVAQSLVSANDWLRGIKTYRFPWYLTLVSANYASSSTGQVGAVVRGHQRKYDSHCRCQSGLSSLTPLPFSSEAIILPVMNAIEHLHDDAIWLQVPESFRSCLSHASKSYCYFYPAGNTNKKDKMNSGSCSQMALSWKLPIL